MGGSSTPVRRPGPEEPTVGAGPAWSAGGRHTASWLIVPILAGLLLVEGGRQGGFWPFDALVVTVVVIAALGAEVLLLPQDRGGWAVMGGTVALALVWLVRAATLDRVSTFLPFGASALGFGTAFVAVRALPAPQRAVAGQFVAALGCLGAAIGFAGLIWRHYPIAIPSQGLWRLASTLTYSDAAGLVLSICLLVALAGGPRPWISRLAVCLCTGGLVAAQSRGAFIALACAVAIVPWRQLFAYRVAILAGLGLGVAAVASSPSNTPVAGLAVAVVAAGTVSLAWAPTAAPHTGRPAAPRWLAALAVLLLAVVVSLLVHHELALRTLSPSDGDRAVEWSAAFHQFTSSPLDGVGPDRLLQFTAPDGDYAHFAHNEYLQVAADVGLIGLAALVSVGLGLVRVVRRVDVATSCATAALVCWAVGGAFDFDWHLPFIGLLGGWVAGMAATTVHRDRTSSAQAGAGPVVHPTGWDAAAPLP
jgi:hypothetical protein